LAQALTALPAEGISVLPLWPKAGEPAKRVIVQVCRASRAPFLLLPGLVLHQQDGASTPEAEAVLRRGAALALSGARL
jgi:tRNA1Val (adenine37-N6)-methyltransferase